MSPWRAPVRAPELAELETLVACATDGSFARAARRLEISRPAVVKRIGNLEALADRPLLHRSSAGVTLTDAGASILAAARRILEERDVLVDLVTEMRTGIPSSGEGLRSLLGADAVATRSAQLAEMRLADTQRLIELLLARTGTAVAITDRESGVIYEANDAFCRFCGRSRAELVGGQSPAAGPDWITSSARKQLVEALRSDGSVENVVARVAGPDGTVRQGRAACHLLALGGHSVILSLIEYEGDGQDGAGEALPAGAP
jgi:DNA-binding transcriptional LysR family regulator